MPRIGLLVPQDSPHGFSKKRMLAIRRVVRRTLVSSKLKCVVQCKAYLPSHWSPAATISNDSQNPKTLSYCLRIKPACITANKGNIPSSSSSDLKLSKGNFRSHQYRIDVLKVFRSTQFRLFDAEFVATVVYCNARAGLKDRGNTKLTFPI